MTNRSEFTEFTKGISLKTLSENYPKLNYNKLILKLVRLEIEGKFPGKAYDFENAHRVKGQAFYQINSMSDSNLASPYVHYKSLDIIKLKNAVENLGYKDIDEFAQKHDFKYSKKGNNITVDSIEGLQKTAKQLEKQ